MNKKVFYCKNVTYCLKCCRKIVMRSQDIDWHIHHSLYELLRLTVTHISEM